MNHLHDLRTLVGRAVEAKNRALVIERELTETHDPPSEYFYRPGWDPLNIFCDGPDTSEPSGVLEGEEPGDDSAGA